VDRLGQLGAGADGLGAGADGLGAGAVADGAWVDAGAVAGVGVLVSLGDGLVDGAGLLVREGPRDRGGVATGDVVTAGTDGAGPGFPAGAGWTVPAGAGNGRTST
jgi:hypothetical protein